MLKGYITYMEYFATGEGFTYQILFSLSNNKEEAIEKHLDKYYGNDKKARDYFGRGITAHDIESKEAEEIITEYFSHGKELCQHMRQAGIEMSFNVYYNHS